MTNSGLSTAEVEISKAKYGINILTPPKREAWYKLLIKEFKEPLIIILLVAAIISTILGFVNGKFTEPIGIIIAIILAVGISFWNIWSATKKFDILLTNSDNTLVRVRRNNELIQIPRKELVVGDIVVLGAGEEVPADIIIKEYCILQVNESSLTGESNVVIKTNVDSATAAYPTNKIYKSTIIVEGTCVGEVFAVGNETEIGKTARQAASITDINTPLNKQLNKLAVLINKIAFIVAIILISSLFIKYVFVEQSYIGKDSITIINDCLQFVMIASTLIVMAVPEGLPMAVTLALAYSMKKMGKANNLVRKMHACETLGATTLILTDKTGTLTENKMEVVDIDFTDINAVFHNIAINSTAELNNKGEIIGNPTEGACLRYLPEYINYKLLRDKANIISRVEFNSNNKYMLTTDGAITYIKGAPEIIKNLCRKVDTISNFEEQQIKGRRCLAFAHKIGKNINNLGDFIWDGYVAIEDPVRENVPDAIQAARNAGIKVKIVTGDNPETAASIAAQANISQVPNTMLGKDVEAQTDTNLCKTDVFARTKPVDKQMLVKRFQNMGEVVSVTGDGTNDSPALNQAEVGIAMNNGTDIAKNAADIILLDNSFPSIMLGVKWGRSLYKNIQHFILFQLTVNIVAISIACIGPFIGVNLSFTVTQMLWVNLIMDTFAALALATEPASEAVMSEKPRDPKAFIITERMWYELFSVGTLYFGILLYLLISSKCNLTEFFTIFIMLQFWNLFNVRVFGQNRSIFSGLLSNPAFISICLIIFIGQILIVQFGGNIFRTEPLSIETWLEIVCFTAIVPVCRELFYWTKKLFK